MAVLELVNLSACLYNTVQLKVIREEGRSASGAYVQIEKQGLVHR